MKTAYSTEMLFDYGAFAMKGTLSSNFEKLDAARPCDGATGSQKAIAQ